MENLKQGHYGMILLAKPSEEYIKKARIKYMETQTANSSNGSLQKAGPLIFQEVLVALMEEGIKVKLPEWTGYWFSKTVQKEDGTSVNEIHVMTKSGDILKDPWIEKYKDRNDWQITDGSLGFDWAINALKNGKLVRRRGWNGKSMFVFMQPGDQLPVEMVIDKVKSLPQSLKNHYANQYKGDFNKASNGEAFTIEFTPYICMKAANGEIVNGWLASQTDMLAEDWELAE